MDIGQDLKEFFAVRPICCKPAVVVDVDDLTCDVELIEAREVKLEKVRLKAHLQGEKSIIIKPAKGSYVLIGFLNSKDAFVAMYDEVDSIIVKVNGQSYTIDKDGFSIDLKAGKFSFKNNQESLKKILQDLISEVSKITVTTQMGPSGTPLNIAQLQLIAQRITMLLQ